ncbi:MAG TPA: hypothetical protein VNK82_01650 [Terriglobales bacterium]|nr:hypothetical protein [Terriglobales bacterium]
MKLPSISLTKRTLLLVGIPLLIITLAGAAVVTSGVLADETLAVEAGTPIRVRLDHSIASRTARPGDAFHATVSQPVTVDGKVVIPVGALAHGTVVHARESGRLSGRAQLQLQLNAIEVNGESYAIETNTLGRVGGSHKKRNIALIGGGAGVGALIGGLAGGGKGVLIGGPVGAGAGLAGAALTGKKDFVLPAETSLTFHLQEPVSLPVAEEKEE